MKSLITTLLLSLVAGTAFAGGVVHVGGGLGAGSLGLSGAWNAVATDAASLYHNVAGLAQTKTELLQVGADVLIPRFGVDLPDSWGGFKADSEFSLLPLPMIMTAKRLSSDVVFSSGLYVPYGLGANYGKNWRHGLLYRRSLLALTNMTMAVSYQLNDKLAVGIGADVGFGLLDYHAPLHQVGRHVFDSVGLAANGNGLGASGRIGLLWQPTEGFSWGLSYSGPMKIHLRGDTDVRLLGLKLGSDEFRSAITFPDRLGTGIALRPTEKWLIALDANYYFSKRLDQLKFNFEWLPTITQKLDWRNNYSIHLGTQYEVAKDWWLSGGMAFLKAAVPETTTNPVIPDADGYCASIGVSHKRGSWTYDVAYLYAWGTRKVDARWANLAPGDYNFGISSISIGATKRF